MRYQRERKRVKEREREREREGYEAHRYIASGYEPQRYNAGGRFSRFRHSTRISHIPGGGGHFCRRVARLATKQGLLDVPALPDVPAQRFKAGGRCAGREREFFVDNLLVRIHSIIEMILVNRPCAMGV